MWAKIIYHTSVIQSHSVLMNQPLFQSSQHARVTKPKNNAEEIVNLNAD